MLFLSLLSAGTQWESLRTGFRCVDRYTQAAIVCAVHIPEIACKANTKTQSLDLDGNQHIDPRIRTF